MKLEISGLTKSFDNTLVLDNITLSLNDAHALVLLGPSGSGKSTLLRILAGLETPDSGSVQINGVPLPREETELIHHRRKLGIVFQTLNLFPHLTALENITLPLCIAQQLPKDDAQKIAIELLQRFRLETHAKKRPYELSGGQRQRIAIARAIAIKPMLLLFDEPTSALDPEMTAEVLEMILDLRREQRDIIIVTHELGFAAHVADQIAVIDQGSLVEFGNAEQIFKNPKTEITRTFLKRHLRYQIEEKNGSYSQPHHLD